MHLVCFFLMIRCFYVDVDGCYINTLQNTIHPSILPIVTYCSLSSLPKVLSERSIQNTRRNFALRITVISYKPTTRPFMSIHADIHVQLYTLLRGQPSPTHKLHCQVYADMRQSLEL